MSRVFFDERFIQSFNPATRSVPLLYFLYLCAVPLAKALINWKVKPNVITTLSNLVATIAIILLVFDWGWLFAVLWIFALLLDIADGTVARVTDQSSAQGGFYDHMSDQIKVIALFLCVGLRYNEQLIWIIAFVVNGFYLFYGIINQFYSVRMLLLSRAKANVSPNSENESQGGIPRTTRSKFKKLLDRNLPIKKIVLGVYSSIFAMYGNCMILLLPVGINREWASFSMMVFALVTFHSALAVVRGIFDVNAKLDQLKTEGV